MSAPFGRLRGHKCVQIRRGLVVCECGWSWFVNPDRRHARELCRDRHDEHKRTFAYGGAVKS